MVPTPREIYLRVPYLPELVIGDPVAKEDVERFYVGDTQAALLRKERWIWNERGEQQS